MGQQIDYYLSSISPFTYLGHARLLQAAADSGANIRYLPIRLGPVFAASGAKPLAERPQPRRDYRLVELERWSKKRARPLNLQPRHFPADPALADRCIIALQEAGQDPAAFVDRVLGACWHEERDIADRHLLLELLTACGQDAEKVMYSAESDQVAALYDRNTDEAVERGILGVPAYVFDGEQFWGQDRLELLADTLTITA